MSLTRAWHFVGDRLRDGRPVPKNGEWLVHDGPVVWCKSGLYASLEPFDTLKYAPGSTLCLVECDDIVNRDFDKFSCRRRRIVARMDATDMLRYYARIQALSVIHLYPDPPDVVLAYLMTGDERIRSAAMAAAWADRAAAWAALASDAVMAATCAAAWAARAAMSGKFLARRDFNELVYECFEGVL